MNDSLPGLPDIPLDYASFANRCAAKGGVKRTVKLALERQVRSRSLAKLPTGTGPEAEELLRAGVDALERRAADPAAPLDAFQQAGLEAVVRLEDRPALFVVDDDFEEPPEYWSKLDQSFGTDIRPRLPVVGCIRQRRGIEGTGFVVAPGVVLTNRHVIELSGIASPGAFDEPAENADPGSPWKLWNLDRTVEPAIDFKAEHGRPGIKRFEILEVIAATAPANRYLDLAFLRVAESSTAAGDSPGGEALPPPVTISAEPPDLASSRELYLVGYPASDNEGPDPDPVQREKIRIAMEQIFGGIFGVKRLQPGECRGFDAGNGVFTHDCSTLGGNSGSCVVDLVTNRVIGAHFRGKRMVLNWAVALWLLKDDKFLRDEIGLRFE